MGGFDSENNEELRTIYEYDTKYGWKLWSNKLPVPVANTTLIQADYNFCEQSKYEDYLEF